MISMLILYSKSQSIKCHKMIFMLVFFSFLINPWLYLLEWAIFVFVIFLLYHHTFIELKFCCLKNGPGENCNYRFMILKLLFVLSFLFWFYFQWMSKEFHTYFHTWIQKPCCKLINWKEMKCLFLYHCLSFPCLGFTQASRQTPLHNLWYDL